MRRQPSDHHHHQNEESNDNEGPRPRGPPVPGRPSPDSSDESSESDEGRRNGNVGRRPIFPSRHGKPGGGPGPSNGSGGPGGPGRPNSPGGPNGSAPGGNNQTRDPVEPQFDVRLKPDAIPSWDGDPETLYRWILKMNALAERSRTVWKQLVQLTPPRLKGSAETWYYKSV